MRYELSWTWNSAAMGCHAALEEIGVPYSLRFIDFDKPWPGDDLERNPNRKVPTLIDYMTVKAGTETDAPDDTVVIYQSAAILLYLADNHPEARLIPATGTPERGYCYQWLFFMAEMLQPSYHMFYYPERHTSEGDSASHQAVETKALEWIDEIWRRIDRAIGNHEGNSAYVLSSGFSVCDLYMLPMALWNGMDARFPTLDGYPNLSRALSNIKARLSVQRMMKDHIQA
ncbi:MAG: glutathione S-transferase family protein [Rhodospirillales bacterium]|nr:glutathione S-transferase family protein [Rhodospirillales bacterium]